MCEQVVCEQVVCTSWVRRRRWKEEEAGGSAQPKTRTPHKDVGKKQGYGVVSGPQGKPTFSSAAQKTNPGIYSIFVSGVKISNLNFAWQARDGTLFFYFDCVFSMYFEGHLYKMLFHTFSFANLPS